MQEKSIGSSFILGLFIALGLGALGYFISHSILKVKMLERSVAVKGLAQKEVKADTAIFPIHFQDTAPSMDELNTKIKTDLEKITKFLTDLGFYESEITISTPQINDRVAQNYENVNTDVRFVSDSLITVYTKKVDKVIKLQHELYKLTDSGIIARNDSYETRYIYTGLNTIKPQMIEVATKNARDAALKFAKDSHSKLGKIKQASQGYFAIEDRDTSTPYIKQIRVVTNVSYYLDD